MASEEGGRDRLAELLGLEYLELGPEHVRARMPVADQLRQPYGMVHGGALTAMAESMCSQATWEAVRADGKVALGQSSHTTFLRPIAEGHANGTATRRAGGRGSTWIWDVEIADDEGHACALVRMAIAVRPAR